MLSEPVVRRLQDPGINRLVIALSGGIDSVVLLDIVSKLSPRNLCAVHINHHLQSEAGEFSLFCESLADRYGISVTVLDVAVPSVGSLETKAREARYQAFENFLLKDDLLLLAHHADDQVETILFRLFRGSRVVGLEGMPRERRIGLAGLLRPLLDISRDEISGYAENQGLHWINDPSNAGLSPDRNFIRHKVIPEIESRFPRLRGSVLAGLRRDEQARRSLRASHVKTLEAIRQSPDALRLSALRQLPADELSELLSAWLFDLGLPLPAGKMLQELTRGIKAGGVIDMGVKNFHLNQFNDILYVLKSLPEIDIERFPLEAETIVPGGRVTNNNIKGEGLRAEEGYQVTFRTGGERLRIRHDRSLKNLFQENHVPAWLRDRIPLIYSGNELVAVAALPGWGVPMSIADDWVAPPGAAGFEISLILADRVC